MPGILQNQGIRIIESKRRRLETDPMFEGIEPCFFGIPFKHHIYSVHRNIRDVKGNNKKIKGMKSENEGLKEKIETVVRIHG